MVEAVWWCWAFGQAFLVSGCSFQSVGLVLMLDGFGAVGGLAGSFVAWNVGFWVFGVVWFGSRCSGCLVLVLVAVSGFWFDACRFLASRLSFLARRLSLV
jgi:hypothetical protein